MAFFGLFTKDYSRNFSEKVVAKDYDLFASIAGIEVAPHLREQVIRDIHAEGLSEYAVNRRLLRRTLRELSLG